VQTFEEVRSHINARFPVRINDPYLISFDMPTISESLEAVRSFKSRRERRS